MYDVVQTRLTATRAGCELRYESTGPFDQRLQRHLTDGKPEPATIQDGHEPSAVDCDNHLTSCSEEAGVAPGH